MLRQVAIFTIGVGGCCGARDSWVPLLVSSAISWSLPCTWRHRCCKATSRVHRLPNKGSEKSEADILLQGLHSDGSTIGVFERFVRLTVTMPELWFQQLKSRPTESARNVLFLHLASLLFGSRIRENRGSSPTGATPQHAQHSSSFGKESWACGARSFHQLSRALGESRRFLNMMICMTHVFVLHAPAPSSAC